jgi:hypothetical protein
MHTHQSPPLYVAPAGSARVWCVIHGGGHRDSSMSETDTGDRGRGTADPCDGAECVTRENRVRETVASHTESRA